jgi:hypothetical protein
MSGKGTSRGLAVQVEMCDMSAKGQRLKDGIMTRWKCDEGMKKYGGCVGSNISCITLLNGCEMGGVRPADCPIRGPAQDVDPSRHGEKHHGNEDDTFDLDKGLRLIAVYCPRFPRGLEEIWDSGGTSPKKRTMGVWTNRAVGEPRRN